MENQKRISASIRLPEQMQENQTENLYAYVVDAGGKILEAAPFEGREARLKASRENLEGETKIYIAQRLPAELRASRANELTLLKAGAYNVVKNFNGNSIDVFRIPDSVLIPFPFHFCLIKGSVNKWFNINDEWKNLPLCDLRVHICEVETELIWPHIPIYYRRIPDWVIVEISEKIKQIVAVEKPVITQPRPVPGPGPDPAPFMQQTKFNLPLRELRTNTAVSLSSRVKEMSKLPQDVTQAISAGSVESIRQAFIDYHDLLYPYFCLWPVYWPWIYSCHEVAVVDTDCNGNFEWWEFVVGNASHNIYIWVEANINGSWQTVYKPALPCHTFWNYQCNTNINITVTDPRVQPCHCGTEGPADAFWFRSIGESAGALHIEQDRLNTRSVQGVNFRNVGCTNIINTDWISPFGGGLGFQVFAGEHIFSAGVTHYRWRAIRVADENLNPIFSFAPPVIVNANDPNVVAREYIVGTGGGHYQSHFLPLADGSGNDLAFMIPHQNIANETHIPAAQQGPDTFWRDVFWNSASFDSSTLGANGLYRFDLELGHRDGAGHFVRDEVNRQIFKISQYSDLDSNQDIPMNPDGTYSYLNIDSVTHKAINFTMLVRVDNSPCHADIHDVMLTDGAGHSIMRVDPADGILKPVQSGKCGFIIYDNPSQSVKLSFEATHPHRFASFSYSVTKGNGTENPNIGVTSGYVFSSVGALTLTAGVFSEEVTVQALLGTCPGQAAFAENLYVAALATNGTSRLQYLDASDTNAFALSNS